MLQYIVVTILAGAAIALASIAWPKFTTQPRPQPLQQVHDVVIKTQAGQEAENVLGVTENTTEGGLPVSLNDIAASVGATIVKGITDKTTEIISNQAALVIYNQYKQLPTPAQEELEKAICKP